MDFLTPPPSVVNAFFAQHYSKSPEEATEYFFNLSKKMTTSKQEPSQKHQISGRVGVW